MFGEELTSLSIIFLFVIIAGIISRKVKQPIGVGLLLIGAIIGPHTLNIVNNQSMIDLMIEFGAILLLFVIGLEFAVSKLLKIGAKAIVFGLLKAGITIFLTYEILILVGFNTKLAFILGILISFSSTVIVVKTLESKKLYNRQETPLLIGILFIEDILAVITITFLAKASESGSVIEHIFISIAVLIIFYLLMLKIADPLISWLMHNSNEEMTPFIALGMCGGFSYLAYSLGFTPATGAFLAGSIVASCKHVSLFKFSVKPYTEIFTSLFFLSMGTLVNFHSIKNLFPIVIVLLLLVIASRFIGVGLVSSLITNFKKEQMVFASIAMMTISEFSLLISQNAMKLNLGMDLVSLTALMIFITSLFMSLSINHYNKISSILDHPKMSGSWSNKPKSLSKYINMLLNDLDIENMNSRLFKKLFINTGLYLIVLLSFIIGWKKIIYYSFGKFGLMIFLVHIIAISVVSYLFYLLYMNTRKMYQILNTILSDNYAHNIKKSSIILNKLLFTITLFIIAIYSPFVLISMPLWFNIIPIIILIISVIKLAKMVKVIDNFTTTRNIFPRYKKSKIFFSKQIRQDE